MKINDVIVCVNPYGRLVGKNNFGKNVYKCIELTKNKKYTILGINYTNMAITVNIINDIGVKRTYEVKRFKLIPDIREEKLNILLNG